MAFRSSYDRTGSASRKGSGAESKFMELARQMGIEARTSSKFEDMYNHVDAWIKLGEEDISVDIKGPKRFSDKDILV